MTKNRQKNKSLLKYIYQNKQGVLSVFNYNQIITDSAPNVKEQFLWKT